MLAFAMALVAFHEVELAAEPGKPMNHQITLTWARLPNIPDREGFAAPFAGSSGGELIVAGGANFPDQRPWEGGTKHWYDTVYLLEAGASSWRTVGKLPRPLAYGVSVDFGGGVIGAGGGDATRHHREVFRLEWKDGKIHTSALPHLPRPCAFASGTVVGSTLYIAGGIEEPAATTCLSTLWALDLGQRDPRWRELEACPGGARMLAVAGAAEGSFFLFSGTSLRAGPDGKPVRQYLRDAWRYTPQQGWKRLADLPRAAVAAASPAPLADNDRLLVISGDDGLHVNFKPETAHPGFPRDVLSYDVKSETWVNIGEAPFSRATVPTVLWNRKVIVPNGEARPGYRSPEVWSLQVTTRP